MSKAKISKAMRRKEERLNEAYRAVLASENGRMVLRDLLDRSGVLAASGVPNGNGGFTSGSETFWREGRRSVGLDLIARLNRITHYAYAGLVEEIAREAETERATQQQGPQTEDEE